jgi:hypothetical protein
LTELTPIKLPLKWTSHPAADEPKKGAFAIVVIILGAFTGAFFMESVIWGLFSMAILFLGLSRYFFQTEYTIDNSGIREKFLGTHKISPWRNFRRSKIVGNYILLSPYPKRSFMDRFRAWNVRTPDKETALFIAELVANKPKPVIFENEEEGRSSDAAR